MSLFGLLKDMPTMAEIKGTFGEYLAKWFSELSTDTLVLHDVLIDGVQDKTSQIDLILVGTSGLYVVEVKSYDDAKIYGDGNKSTWYYYLRGKKYDIYSPVKQNKKHIEYLKTFLAKFGDLPFYSVVYVCCEGFKVSNLNRDPDKPDTIMCNSLPSLYQALVYMSQFTPDAISEEQKISIHKYITEHQHTGKEARVEHKQQVRGIVKSKLEQKESHLCPYCNAQLILRQGKFGEFYGCRNYPKCKYTRKK